MNTAHTTKTPATNPNVVILAHGEVAWTGTMEQFHAVADDMLGSASYELALVTSQDGAEDIALVTVA